MPSMNLPGLSGTRYVGYFAESGIDPTWFATASADKSEVRTNWYNALSGINGYSWEYTGFFVPLVDGDYAFSGNTDDATVMWLGSAAEVQNFDTTNFLFSADASYFQTNYTLVTLSAGVAYPIRIQWGHPTEPTASLFNLGYEYIPNGSGWSSYYTNWESVTYHQVPYTFNFVQQPTSQSGPAGSLLTFSCSAVASNGAPVSYSWFLSSADYFTEGPRVLNLSQLVDFSPNNPDPILPQVTEFIRLIQSSFKANTNTLVLRNTDATLNVTSGRPLSSFSFVCVPYISPELAPSFTEDTNSELDFTLDRYPHSNLVSTSITSYPEYADGSPYYALNIGTVRPLSANPSGDINTLFIDVALFPGLIVFGQVNGIEIDGTASVTVTGNPNLAQNNPIYIGINSAEGYLSGNESAYLSQLITLSAGFISFTQNSNTATYNFNNTITSAFALYNDASGPLEGTVSGMYGNVGENALQLVSPSPSDFNSYDPITVTITETTNEISEFERVANLHGGIPNFLRLRLLGCF